MEKESKEISEPCKFENRVLGPTVLLVLRFEQLTAEPILLFRKFTSNSRWSVCSKEALNNGLPGELAGVLRGSFAFDWEIEDERVRHPDAPHTPPNLPESL